MRKLYRFWVLSSRQRNARYKQSLGGEKVPIFRKKAVSSFFLNSLSTLALNERNELEASVAGFLYEIPIQSAWILQEEKERMDIACFYHAIVTIEVDFFITISRPIDSKKNYFELLNQLKTLC